ncbi:MAG: HEAT repeat domain-containing protein [Bryobacterales bacterium]
MSKGAFEEKIREIERLRSVPGPATQSSLVKALNNRSNYLVSKAAAVVADLQLAELVPNLITAFDRFLVDAVKTDPQCWAKIAIAKALKDLGHRDAGVFLRGAGHIQLEPVFGGRQDTAGPVRSVCSLALVDCQLDDIEILSPLADLLTDTEASVRVDAAFAIAQLGSAAGTLLLRLKARVGDAEPEVTGQCLYSLLSLGSSDAVAFAAAFLDHSDEQVRAEAATALGAARDPAALDVVIARYRSDRDPELRHALVTAAGASPIPAAADFLLGVIAKGDQKLALAAIEALAASRFRNESRAKAESAVNERHDDALSRLFVQQFADG